MDWNSGFRWLRIEDEILKTRSGVRDNVLFVSLLKQQAVLLDEKKKTSHELSLLRKMNQFLIIIIVAV